MFIKEKLGRKILIVDDEESLLNMIVSILKDDGFKIIQTAQSVREAQKVIQTFEPDIVLLDIMLPDGTGFELFDFIQRRYKVPVIFLTAKGEDKDKLKGLSLGADDYIVKPFLPKELVLRIEAILRRVYPEESSIYLEHSSIDFDKGLVTKKNEVIPLTATEYKILETLNDNANRIVTIDFLCETVWGDVFGYDNSLMAHIRRIREKIEDNPSKPDSLLTVRGLGYKLLTKNRREVR